MPSKRAEKVWKRLMSWYGSRLAEQFGPHAPDDWAEFFDRNDDERLRAALETVRRASPVYPPTLGQIEAALPAKPRPGARSIPQRLGNEAPRRFGSQMCGHQLMGPWNYFSERRGRDEVLGVQINGCAVCGKPSHRVRVDELPSEQDAAA
jgi:hypothetical protein